MSEKGGWTVGSRSKAIKEPALRSDGPAVGIKGLSWWPRARICLLDLVTGSLTWYIALRQLEFARWLWTGHIAPGEAEDLVAKQAS
jgi:hypothetical protein